MSPKVSKRNGVCSRPSPRQRQCALLRDSGKDCHRGRARARPNCHVTRLRRELRVVEQEPTPVCSRSRSCAACMVALMCRVHGVAPSGYYAWRLRPPLKKSTRDAVLLPTFAPPARRAAGVMAARESMPTYERRVRGIGAESGLRLRLDLPANPDWLRVHHGRGARPVRASRGRLDGVVEARRQHRRRSIAARPRVAAGARRHDSSQRPRHSLNVR